MNDTGFEFVLLVLAIYRVTLLFAVDEGPFALFARFREFLGVRYDEFGIPIATNSVAKMVLCYACLSVWITFGMILVSIVSQVVIYILALAGAALLIRGVEMR